VELKKVNRRVIESLIKAGAFDSLSNGWRASLLFRLEEAMDRSNRLQAERESAQGSLFDMGMASVEPVADPPGGDEVPATEEWSFSERLACEKEALGFFLSGHPLREFKSDLDRCGAVDLQRLLEMPGGSVVTVGGFVSARKEIQTKKGDKMAFLTLEDEVGRLEIIVFPEVYRQGALFLDDEEPIVVEGTLEVTEESGPEEEGDEGKKRVEPRRSGAKMVASKILPLREFRYADRRSIHLALNPKKATRDKLEELRDILLDFRGPCRTYLHLAVPEMGEVVIQASEDFSVRPCSELVAKVDSLFGGNVVRT
jgi:DNA polymerase-3 subunit alpha